jgi:arginyl-tRNA synthetase
MYEKSGYDVFREYYVNDAGNQMDMLGKSIFSLIRGRALPENGYRGEYLKDVAEALKDAADERECSRRGGEMILESHKKDLSDFGVEYDAFYHEKDLFAAGRVKAVLDMLNAEGLSYEKDGALWFRSSDYGDDADRVLMKTGGEMTYFASDCAYHKYKGERFSHLVNIWGADHHGYVPRINAFWKAGGLDDRKLEVILYQLVNLRRGKEKVSMSTRSGEFVTLKETVEDVGRDAARFFMLMRSHDAPVEFDLDLAKQENRSNPVYYVQYSYARICSVFRKLGLDMEDYSLGKYSGYGPQERALIVKFGHFPYLLEKAVELNSPHLMTEYLRELSSSFHKYYDSVRVIGSPEEAVRLAVLKAAASLVRTGLDLIGVSAPSEM